MDKDQPELEEQVDRVVGVRMNCIEFLIQDENGAMHGGRILQEVGSEEPITKDRMERIREGLLDEGFKILRIELVHIQ